MSLTTTKGKPTSSLSFPHLDFSTFGLLNINVTKINKLLYADILKIGFHLQSYCAKQERMQSEFLNIKYSPGVRI